MLASRFSRIEHFKENSIRGFIFNGFERFLHRLNNWYGRLIQRVLKPIKIPYRSAYVAKLKAQEAETGIKKKDHFNFYGTAIFVLFATTAIFLSSFKLITDGYIGSTFVTNGDRSEFILKLELPKHATLKESNLATLKAEKYLFNQPEIKGVFTTVGLSSGMISSREALNMSEMTIKLVPKDQRDLVTDHYAQKVRDELERLLPGVKVTSAAVSFFGGADQDPIIIFISGPDNQEVMEYAHKVIDKIQKIPGTLEAKLSIEEGTPEVKVTVDRERMAKLGVNMEMVGMTMQTAFNGNTDAQFRADKKEYDIQIKMDGFNRNNIDDIANLAVLNNKGQLIRMDQFADIVQSTGPNQLERKNRLSSVTINSKVLGRPSGEVGFDIKEMFASELPPPDGINITYDGDIRQQDEGFGSLGLAFLASILLVYLILVALYDSWVYPLVVLFSIPVAIVGALLALALSMSLLDIFSMVGMIMLVGLVAKNAILLVDFANQSKLEGMDTNQALVAAGRTRLRPILMTTLSMAIGFLPIALAQGAAAEWKNGLAWALIGGLLSSMILTLVVVPVVYLMVDGIKTKFLRLIGYEGLDMTEGELTEV